jgi:hypothetical protein
MGTNALPDIKKIPGLFTLEEIRKNKKSANRLDYGQNSFKPERGGLNIVDFCSQYGCDFNLIYEDCTYTDC